MKKYISLVFLVLAGSCKESVEESYMNPEKASAYFSRIEDACIRDSGKLWGKNLSGPVMFIDRTSRKIVSGQPDTEGMLKPKDGIYSGFYPREKIISTAAVEVGGTMFGLVPLPAEEDDYRIMTRSIHALFHRIQYLEGINTFSFNTPNMDEKDSRIWLKLEWKALKKALTTDGEEQLLAIRDALIFRGSYRETYPKFADLQNQFESTEGLATFTSLFLTTGSFYEYKDRLLEYLDRIYSFQSYARSYGTIHGALYATLLYEKGISLSLSRSDKEDLGNLVREVYAIELPLVCRDVAGSIAIHYSVDDIIKEEELRDQAIRERLENQVSNFTEKPVVYLDLESPYFDFEPEDVESLDTLGTLYNSLRVSDNWGKLTVDEGGCLISNNYRYLRVPAKGYKAEKNHISGDGWQIILNDGWEIARVEDNYFVRKLIP